MGLADGSAPEPCSVFGCHDRQSFEAVLWGLPLSGLVVMRHSLAWRPYQLPGLVRTKRLLSCNSSNARWTVA